jgi:plasmid stabilization system protein ParE
VTHGFEQEALTEYREAAEYYAQQRGGLGKVFVEAVQASLQEIGRGPSRYQALENGLRICRMKRFPYSIYFRYSEERDHATVFAVMHTRRRPGYWRHRLKDE